MAGEITTWPENLWPERYSYPEGLVVNPNLNDPTAEGKPLWHTGDQPRWRTWSVVYRHLTPTQMETLRDFQESVGVGVEPFYWTDVRPINGDFPSGADGVEHLVQLAEPIKFDTDDEGTAYRCEVSFNEAWDMEP